VEYDEEDDFDGRGGRVEEVGRLLVAICVALEEREAVVVVEYRRMTDSLRCPDELGEDD